MILQSKNNGDFKRASELLYAFYAVDKYAPELNISRLAIQKIHYLSKVLAPIKQIALQIARYIAHYQGPWNPEIQATIDHLIGLNYLEVVSFKRDNEKRALAYYRITDKGRFTVKNLIRIKSEEEKNWWITTIVRLVINNLEMIDNSEFEDLNKVRDIVYADPTFDEHLKLFGKNKGDVFKHSEKTKWLIEYSKSIYKRKGILASDQTERVISEFLLVGFFNYLTENAIANNDSRRS